MAVASVLESLEKYSNYKLRLCREDQNRFWRRITGGTGACGFPLAARIKSGAQRRQRAAAARSRGLDKMDRQSVLNMMISPRLS